MVACHCASRRISRIIPRHTAILHPQALPLRDNSSFRNISNAAASLQNLPSGSFLLFPDGKHARPGAQRMANARSCSSAALGGGGALLKNAGKIRYFCGADAPTAVRRKIESLQISHASSQRKETMRILRPMTRLTSLSLLAASTDELPPPGK